MTRPEPDAEHVAALARAAPARATLCRGMFGEIATYLPGRRVPGVRVGPGSAEIDLVARYRLDGVTSRWSSWPTQFAGRS